MVVRQQNLQRQHFGGDARVRHHQPQTGIVSAAQSNLIDYNNNNYNNNNDNIITTAIILHYYTPYAYALGQDMRKFSFNSLHFFPRHALSNGRHELCCDEIEK